MNIKARFRKILLEREGDYGYHVGTLKEKSEFLGEKGFAGRDLAISGMGKPSKTGQFGAGHFFFGDLAKAEEYRGFKKEPIIKVDFSKYKMFRPADPEGFVEGAIGLTNSLLLVPEGFTEDEEYQQLVDDLVVDLPHFGINLDRNAIDSITAGFIHDVTTKSNPNSDYIITRYLKAAGYEGLDLRGTKYDSFYIGSVIYDIKEGTVSKV